MPEGFFRRFVRHLVVELGECRSHVGAGEPVVEVRVESADRARFLKIVNGALELADLAPRVAAAGVRPCRYSAAEWDKAMGACTSKSRRA